MEDETAAPSEICRLSSVIRVGGLAERQGTALLTRRDLRVGQVRLLHPPPYLFENVR